MVSPMAKKQTRMTPPPFAGWLNTPLPETSFWKRPAAPISPSTGCPSTACRLSPASPPSSAGPTTSANGGPVNRSSSPRSTAARPTSPRCLPIPIAHSSTPTASPGSSLASMNRATGGRTARRLVPTTSRNFSKILTHGGVKHFAPETPESTGEMTADPRSHKVLTPFFTRPYTRSDAFRGVAQLVARGVWDAEAGGSSPLTPTLPRSLPLLPTRICTRFAGVPCPCTKC